MLDSLKATVLLLNQDIEWLVRELIIQSSSTDRKPCRNRREVASHSEVILRTHKQHQGTDEIRDDEAPSRVWYMRNGLLNNVIFEATCAV
jgi:hypothetical protein